MRPDFTPFTCGPKPVGVQAPPYAPTYPNHPDLRVGFGQTTFDAEGLESRGPHFSRVMHWPGGASGVTIGRGYDMGHRTRLQVLTELRNAGMPEGDAEFFSKAAGLKRDDARRFVHCNVADAPVISLPVQRRLFEYITTPETIADIKWVLSKQDLREKYGEITWDQLTPLAQEVVFDLRYRGDYRPDTRIRLQPLIVAGDDRGLSALLADKSYWASLGVPSGRIQARIDMTTPEREYRKAS